MAEQILIVSSKIDEPTYEPVAQILENRGFDVIRYQTDAVLSGVDRLTLTVDENARIIGTYNDKSIAPGDVSAAWYRKVGSHELPYVEPDLAKRQYLNTEIRLMHDMIWSLYPDELWISPPDTMRQADRKTNQMQVANAVGFNVPKTVISNQWDDIADSLLDQSHDRIAIKMLRGIINEGQDLKALYTTTADRHRVASLAECSFSFPGYYRSFYDKVREWRITVVGEDVFPVAIYTEDEARIDWRRHQTKSSVIFKSEEIEDEVADRCLKYLGSVGLQYGAFDLIETVNDGTIFLECNPNGHYGWLEDELDLGISRSFAKLLMKISHNNC